MVLLKIDEVSGMVEEVEMMCMIVDEIEVVCVIDQENENMEIN